MTVHVVIPVHNHIDETMQCLHCLQGQRFRDWRTIVVDDGSTDGTAEVLARNAPEVEVISGDGNLWWSGATALGIDQALSRAVPDDFVLLLNNDTSFDPDYLDALLATSKKYGRALTGSLNVDSQAPERILDSGIWWDWPDVQARKVLVLEGAEDTTAINTLSGRGMLVPIEVFKHVGSIDARRLPHYTADYEFACRARRAGFPLALSYGAVLRVCADISGSEGDLATPRTLREVGHLLFSRRSIRNLRTRLMFVRLACPPRYRLRNWLAVLALAALLITNVPPLFQIKNGLFRLLPRRYQRWLMAHRMMVARLPSPADEGTAGGTADSRVE